MALERVRHLDDGRKAALQSFVIPAGEKSLAFADIGLAPEVHEPQPMVVGSRGPQVLDLEEFIDLFELVGLERKRGQATYLDNWQP